MCVCAHVPMKEKSDREQVHLHNYFDSLTKKVSTQVKNKICVCFDSNTYLMLCIKQCCHHIHMNVLICGKQEVFDTVQHVQSYFLDGGN